MNDKKTNPSHYKLGKIEVIEVTEQFDFCTGNALKYLMLGTGQTFYTQERHSNERKV